MKKPTRYYKVNSCFPEPEYLEEAARALRQGGVVAFPTETVYGLGANALDDQALAKIFQAKGRPADNPLIVHVARREEVADLVSRVSEPAEALMDRFWPGPLTLIFPRSGRIPDLVTAGLDTVAVRMPRHPVALGLLKAAQVPVAAPSANLSGRPSPTSGLHVLKDLAGKIDMILDGGRTAVGVESTVLDLTVQPPQILRPGGLSKEDLEAAVGEISLDPALEETSRSGEFQPRAPGMKYTHYSPAAVVYIVRAAGRDGLVKVLAGLIRQEQFAGKKSGLLVTAATAEAIARQGVVPDYLEVLGNDPGEIAANLYQALRNCDRHHLQVVYAEGIEEAGIGLAVMNRLLKAAGHRVIQA